MRHERILAPPRSPSQKSIAGAVVSEARVIGALIMRDAISRFGRHNIGFFWVMGEPLLLTIGVTVLWLFAKPHGGHDVPIVPFILTGYSMLTVWRHFVSRATRCLQNNVGLLFHRQVRPLDIILAQAILESVACLAAFFIAYVPYVLLTDIYVIRDPLVFIGAWLLLCWIGLGASMILASLTAMSEVAEHFIQPVMYITIPLTGAFFFVDWMPASVQEVLLWSPLVHCSEMFRAGLFPEDVVTYWNPWYVVVFGTVQVAIGLALLEVAQRRVRME